MTDAPTKPGSPTPALKPSLGALRQVLDANHRRWTALSVLRLVSIAVAAPLVYFLLVVVFEINVHFNRLGRVLACAGLVAGLAWSLYYLARGRRELRRSEEELALAMEERTGARSVGNRLINAVQLARDSGASPLHAAAIEENVNALNAVQLQAAASARPALWAAGVAGALLAVGVGLWMVQQERFANAAARIMMPLAAIDPLYRTTLTVEPGDVSQLEDVLLSIAIAGEHPGVVTVTRVSGKERIDEVVAVPADAWEIKHVLRGALSGSAEYWVQAADFRSPTYSITAPMPWGCTFTATYNFPAYTKLPPKTTLLAGGDLEAVEGTDVSLLFKFSHPVARGVLVLETGADTGSGSALVSHGKLSTDSRPPAFTLHKQRSYSVRVEREDGSKEVIGPFAIRILPDQEPQLELTGLERSRELAPDAEVPLKISASDDFGVVALGLFCRPFRADGGDQPWREIKLFPCDGSPRVRGEHRLKASDLAAAEGDRIEIAVRAQDTSPKRETWSQGPTVDVVFGGEGAGLQAVYEQILKSGKDLAALAARQEETARPVTSWQRKLDGEGELRWDDPKNIKQLDQAIAKLEAAQDAIKKDAGKLARTMPEAAGSLRLSIGLLADTEMVRVQRILGSVPTRETPALRQAALADAKITLERIGRSLDDVREQYALFRQEWERSHMISFAKLLADRQHKLKNGTATAPRQRKVLDIAKLVAPAFGQLAERPDDGPELAAAYRHGAEVLASEALASAIQDAAAALEANRPAAVAQMKASEMLTDVYQRLKRAQVDAARKALAALRERAKTDPRAKAEIDDLPVGLKDALVKDFPDDLKLDDTTRLQDIVAAAKKAAADKAAGEKPAPAFFDVDPKQLELEKDSGVRQDTDTLKLGNKSEKTADLMLPNADKFNKVQPFIQEKFDDLVGKLLDEADELDKKYQTIKLSTNQNNNDPGEIGKNGGAISSTGAVAATGNKKPPTTDGGGVARTGRQGARAFGMVADNVAPDMRGRDKALDGMQEAPDQKGTMKLQKTPDPQQDVSTGVGGKKVESDETHFSLHDAGKWKDDMAGRMDKAQKKYSIVERQGEKMDPKVAAQLRDLASQQEQVIERLKSVKKELKNLYLPTDHLDDLEAKLKANLERLQEHPDADLFRLQLQTLDRLRGAAKVFRAAAGNFAPSVPRDRRIQGRVVDAAPTAALPGYEDAVKGYYLRLVDQ